MRTCEYLTVNQVAKLVNLGVRTVQLYFDQGILKGYRLPGRGDRRIHVSSLWHVFPHLSSLAVIPNDKRSSKTYTTGQVAKICNVTPNTVISWIQAGWLQAYRLPGSRRRRIPRKELIRFCQKYAIPLGALEKEELQLEKEELQLEKEELHKILCVATDSVFQEHIRKFLPEKQNYDLAFACNAFEAGILTLRYCPHIVIIDLALGTAEAEFMVQQINRICPAIWSVGLVGEDVPEPKKLDKFDQVYQKPCDFEALRAWINSISRRRGGQA